MPITSVSDTARWVAWFRVLESRRRDALFHDPFAERLAGREAEALAREIPSSSVSRAIVVRTVLGDRIISDLVARRGVDLVVNLAAGLDTRPWRMPLPPSLLWVDVDLPGILDYKTGLLAGEPTQCRYEAVRADLTDPGAVGELLARLATEPRTALAITEGLLIYLDAAQVTALARALRSAPVFKWWLTDLASPRLLEFITRSHGRHLTNAPVRFGPAEGTAFFRPLGWEEAEFHSTILEARRMKRPMPRDWIFRILSHITPRKKVEEVIRMSGTVLLRAA